ncbi:hypothetical protein FEM08_36320 [Flavobacterium gilvum]|nr:hypothetical protein FEM08_36320 [Flavobacterium gilvum]
MLNDVQCIILIFSLFNFFDVKKNLFLFFDFLLFFRYFLSDY